MLDPQILECIPLNVAVLNSEMQLLQCNDNFRRFLEQSFGVELQEGTHLVDTLPADKQLRWQLRLQEVLRGQCTRVEEALEIRGQTRYFDVAYQPLDQDDGKWDKIVIFFEEITARKKRELKLGEDARTLKDLVATRDTLLSVISHDLRSPIFQLNGLLYLIRQASESRDEARLQMQAEDLEERISHLTHTIDNLLRWASLQRMDLEPQVTSFSLVTLMKHAVGLLKPSAQRKGVRVHVGDLTGITLSSDREMVAFIVRNLVNNAIKFSNEGGEVEIEAQQHAEFVSISIQDEGIGFDPEEVQISSPRIGSKVGTWGEQGTGIGLNLCYEFAERLNGTLDVKSQTDLGTKVIVRLPPL